MQGGCLCGAIRYEIEGAPVAQVVCHCRNCQKQGGSAFSVLAGARTSQFRMTGRTKVFADTADSGNRVDRHFCEACGSPIFSALPGAPDMVYVKAGTLDDPAGLQPKVHVWVDSAWPWTAIPDGSVTIAKNPPAR